MEELGLGYSLNDSDAEEEGKDAGDQASDKEEGEEQLAIKEMLEQEGFIMSEGGGGKDDAQVHDNTSLKYKLLDELHMADQNNPIHQQYSEFEMLAKAG